MKIGECVRHETPGGTIHDRRPATRTLERRVRPVEGAGAVDTSACEVCLRAIWALSILITQECYVFLEADLYQREWDDGGIEGIRSTRRRLSARCWTKLVRSTAGCAVFETCYIPSLFIAARFNRRTVRLAYHLPLTAAGSSYFIQKRARNRYRILSSRSHFWMTSQASSRSARSMSGGIDGLARRSSSWSSPVALS